MKFVLISTHVDQTTGYAKVAHNLLKQLTTLSPKVKIYHFGFQRHPSRTGFRKVPEGVSAYDAALNEEPKEEGFGFNKIQEYLDMVNPDVVMIYNDSLIIHRFLETMKHERGKSPYKLWVYLDQVYNGIAKPLMDKLYSHADRIYTFTEQWKEKLLEQYGEFPDVRVLGHAVDPTMFTSMTTESRLSVRKNMNIPENAILFLNANRNSQRKRLDLTLSAFVRLLKERPNDILYLLIATNMAPQAGSYYDIQRIFTEEVKRHGLNLSDCIQRLLIVDTSPPNVLGDDGINQLYNLCDIGINTSDGEGYGLCQLEHMYTGAPQIVTNIGSYKTFLNDQVAEFIEPQERVYFSGSMPLGLYAPSFSSEDVTSCMKRMIDTLPEKRKAVSNYQFKSWASICDQWLEDVLTEVSN